MEERLIIDFFNEENKHWWHIAKRSLIKKFIRGENLRILVVGTGGGLICDELRRVGHNVVGVDISYLSCKYVNEKFDIPVLNVDLESPLTFLNESFDLVIMADVLEHIDNENQLLMELFGCLKSGGALIITVPAYAHMWSSWDVQLNHKRRYSLNMIRDKICEAGFRIKKLTYYHAFLYPLVYFYRKVIKFQKNKDYNKSDFTILPYGPISVFFSFCCLLERKLLEVFELPFGLSILVIGVKHG